MIHLVSGPAAVRGSNAAYKNFENTEVREGVTVQCFKITEQRRIHPPPPRA